MCVLDAELPVGEIIVRGHGVITGGRPGGMPPPGRLMIMTAGSVPVTLPTSMKMATTTPPEDLR